MISKTAEYAIRAALWLAGHPGQSWSVHHIARETEIPAKYLAKVMQALGRAKLVKAQPGPGGGFLLARAAATIGLLEIVAAADPIRRIRTCPLDEPRHAGGLCPLHSRLDRVLATIEDAFRSCTLSELLAESTDYERACEGTGCPIDSESHSHPSADQAAPTQSAGPEPLLGAADCDANPKGEPQ